MPSKKTKTPQTNTPPTKSGAAATAPSGDAPPRPAAKPETRAKHEGSGTGKPSAKSTKPVPTRASRAPRTAGNNPRTGALTAAYQILVHAKEPMRVREITKATIDKGLWSPEGKTPWSTLAAAIGREIKVKGKQSRFKKTDRGLFAATGTKA